MDNLDSRPTDLLIGLAKVLSTIFAYCLTTIGAGHGIAPAGVIHVFVLTGGWEAEPGMLSPSVSTWLALLGSALLLLHLIPPIGRSRVAAYAGVAVLALSVLALLPLSEIAPLPLITAIPFALAARWLLGEDRSSSEPGRGAP